MWSVLWVSFLSGMSTPLGGLLATRFSIVTKEILGFFLGIAAGIMTTVILVDLMPASLQADRGRQLFAFGAVLGWVFMWVVRRAVAQRSHQMGSIGQKNFRQMGIFIALAIGLHDLPEGLAIGAGHAVAPQIGLVIALAIALHNIPEGMSVAMPLLLSGMPRSKIVWLTTELGLITPLGTLLSLGLFHISQGFIAVALAFASGSMAFVVARDIFPEALAAKVRFALAGLLSGALLMIAVHAIHG